MKRKKKTSATPTPTVAEQFPAIGLIARVLAHPSEAAAAEMTQDEIRQVFLVSDQTIRNWTKRGLPWRRGPGGKPRYPAFAALCWVQCWQALEAVRDRDAEAAGWLTPAHAINWRLQSEFDRQGWREDHGPPFVIVPLDWDHPDRERMLRFAARGTMPPCDVPDLSLDGEIYTEAFDAVAAEWAIPLPRIQPSPPLPVAAVLLDGTSDWADRPKYFRPREHADSAE